MSVLLRERSENGAIESMAKKEGKKINSQYAHFDWWFSLSLTSSKSSSRTHSHMHWLCVSERDPFVCIRTLSVCVCVCVRARNSVCNYLAHSLLLPYLKRCACSCANSRSTHRSACEQTKDRLNGIREKESWLLQCVWAREHGIKVYGKEMSDDSAVTHIRLLVCKNFSIQYSIQALTLACNNQPAVSLSFSLLWVQPKCQNQSLDVSTNCGCVPIVTKILNLKKSISCKCELSRDFSQMYLFHFFVQLCLNWIFMLWFLVHRF